MRLVTLKLCGYRQFVEPTVLHFPDGLSGICGPNGVGKSKLIEAIGYALYGAASPVLPKGDKVIDLPSRASATGTADAAVTLVLEVRGQLFEIVRSRRTASVRAQDAAEPLAVGAKAVTAKVIEILHLSPAAYYGTFVAQQKEVAGLQSPMLSPDDRKRLVNRLIGIEQVEYALKLATAERKTRADRLAITRAHLAKKSEVVIAEREALRAQQISARTEEQACDAAAAAAQRVYLDAGAVVTDIQNQIDAHAVLVQRRNTLQTHWAAVETSRTHAQTRLDQATAAAQELAAAHAELEQMADVPRQLDRWDQLEAIEHVRVQQAVLQRDLDERLAPLLAARDEVLTTISADTTELAALLKNRSALELARARLEQQQLQAKERADRFEQRYNTVRQLGATEACETCGQKFGDRLDDALAHYAAERDAARQEETRAAQQVTAFYEHESAEQQRIREQEERGVEHRTQLQGYVDVPGEIASAQRTLAELATRLAGYTPDALRQSYDAVRHDAVRTADQRRVQVERDVARLQPMSDAESGVREELREIMGRLRALDEEKQKIETALLAGSPRTDHLEAAQEQLVAASSMCDQRLEEAREASRQATRISTQLEASEQAVAEALMHEQRITAAGQDVLVAERTAEILNQLLVEITAEARPRLEDLLNSWSRALLGQRFRRIELTDDYRIQADNGSGLHLITHFSGGEQTLLAVMLRVAIALFCRERAGFDTSFLILDEVFGDQDGDHREQLVQFLGEVKEHYHQILVINHIQDVTDMLDSIIDVKPTAMNASTAELRS